MKSLLFLFATLLTLFSCSKDDNKSQKPIDQLPPATQVGANTAGCLVNGEAFLPKGTSLGGPILSCFYQRNQYGYHLGLSINQKSSGQVKTVQFGANPNQLVENTTYSLVAMKDNTFSYISNFGEYYILSINDGDTNYYTTDIVTGELKITKLDSQLNIISGTFWYDAVNVNNEKVQVRSGRFDMHYVN
jgi:hypothetical protein